MGAANLSTVALAARALWIVANLAMGSVVWSAAVFYSILTFQPDPKALVPSGTYDTIVFGLLVTASLLALAVAPFALVNWPFRRFTRTVRPRAFWGYAVALAFGAAVISLGLQHWL